MKIKTGKLTASQAVMIGLLLIVFRAVLPKGKSPAGTSADSDRSDATTRSQVPAVTKAESPPANRTIPAVDLSRSEKTGSSATFRLPVRPLALPTSAQLPEISASDPFFTTAAQSLAAEKVPPTDAHPPEPEEMPQSTATSEHRVENARLNLIYSSNTGRSAAVLNDRILRHGESNEEGIALLRVYADSIEVHHGPAPSSSGRSPSSRSEGRPE